MTVGFHSPRPPARTGVADYGAALARALEPHARLEWNPSTPRGVNLYHLGNNQLHREIYLRALQWPGVVVLHDAVLHHFFLGWLDERTYIDEFVYNYGEWNRGLAHDLWRLRAGSAQDPVYFRYPMLRRVAEVSRAVIVHNPAAARMVREHAPAARVIEIPHLFELPDLPPLYEVTRWRGRLGEGCFLFGLFGHLRESKRLMTVLRVFGKVRQHNPRAWLLVAGPFASSDLARAVEPWLSERGVIRVDYLPEREFWLHARAADACINLRYPAAGETSGIAIRMMGIGKPVLVTGGEEVSRFPGACCIRVDPGLPEEEMLSAYLLWLSREPTRAEQIGAAAAAHIRSEHMPEKVAEQYLAVLRDAAN